MRCAKRLFVRRIRKSQGKAERVSVSPFRRNLWKESVTDRLRSGGAFKNSGNALPSPKEDIMRNRFSKTVATLTLAATLAVAQGTPAQAGFLEDLLFAPTQDPEYVPQTYGTRYDCKAAKQKYGAQNVWHGLIGGRKQVDIRRVRQFSREGCFQTEAECKAFLNYMSTYFLQVFTSSCRKGG